MIPFIDLESQYSQIQEEVETAVLRVMRSGRYILGPEVQELEHRLAAFAGTKYAVSCASGTDALVIALLAKGIGPGDAVFTTPFTFVASAEAIALVGATPVFVDVDQDTFNISPTALRAAIERFTEGGERFASLSASGIIAVDLFGLPADFESIEKVAQEHELFVIEDAAQSFGAKSGNRMAGALAEIGCTSFFPAKPLGCYGDGGALFTDDERLAHLFRSIRVHGQGSERYENVRLGLTGRLDTVQAAVLLAKLAIFPDELEKRQRVADDYAEAIRRTGLPLKTPRAPEGRMSSWAQYSLLAESKSARQEFQDRLTSAGVPSAIYYPKPLHLQEAFAHLGYKSGDFPISESLSERIFSVPMHPYLDHDQVTSIVHAMHE
jgi:UDP-2-acetamido-2-deoxy-ribo-hexuluronate aminotransferase